MKKKFLIILINIFLSFPLYAVTEVVEKKCSMSLSKNIIKLKEKNIKTLQPMCVSSLEKVKKAHPCAKDVRLHCSDQKMRIGQCLESKFEKLSKTCKIKVNKNIANREAVNKDCGNEVIIKDKSKQQASLLFLRPRNHS